MISYALQVSVCMACFIAYYYAVLRRETMFEANRSYLLFTLLASFIMPLIRIYVESASTASTWTEVPVYVTGILEGVEVRSVASSSPVVWNWWWLAAGVYGAVVLVLLGRFLMSIARIYGIRRRSTVYLDSGMNCVMSPEIACPFSFFNTIYIPAHHTFTEEEWREVITHELVHTRGRHTWDVLLIELCCIVLWPSPLVYLYRKAIRDVHEYIADAVVTQSTPWDRYAQLLVDHQGRHFQMRLSNHLIFSQLKKRLLMMNRKRSSAWMRLKYTGLIPIIALGLILFSIRQHADSKEASDMSPSMLSGSTPVLYISEDGEYYLDGVEVAPDRLPDALSGSMQGRQEWIVNVVMHPRMTMDQFIKVDDIAAKLQIIARLHVRTDEEIPYGWIQEKEEMTKAQSAANQTSGESFLAGNETGNTPDTQNPVFPGCQHLPMADQQKCSMEKMYAFIADHLVYPESLKKAGTEGKVFVKFMVGANGYIKEAAIARSLSPEADAACLELVNSMNQKAGQWLPVMKEGKAVDAEMILPINFVLSDETNAAPLQYAEEMPYMKGCEHESDISVRKQCAQELMFKFIHDNLVYPKEDMENGVMGHCVVQFVISAEGKMKDIIVRRFPSETMKAEVIRVFTKMAQNSDWWSGKHEGKEVPVQLTIPVKFSLGPTKDLVPDEKEGQSQNTVQQDDVDQIYPNPAQNRVEVPLFEQASSIIMLNANGSQVRSWTASNALRQELDISNIPSGVYYIRVQSPTRASTYTLTIQ